MNVIIHRGQNQIGGNIIEITAENTRILLDVGLELDQEEGTLPEIDGLFDHPSFDAVFISHYHGDHLGLAYYIDNRIPLYIGEASYRIVKAADDYKGLESITPSGFLRHLQPIAVGSITVTPFLCDHSAFDSYMLLCEADGEKLLYTGDFRSNGRKSFDRLLHALPNKVDKLICEGTTLSRNAQTPLREADLEEQAVAEFRNATGPIFVLQSSTNIDRIVTMYRAAKRSGRVFLQEVYMADVTSAIGGSIPNPSFDDVYAFLTNPKRHDALVKYRRMGKERMAKTPFVMCVRSSMLRYLKGLAKLMNFEGGLLVYSMWSGYRQQPAMSRFIAECEGMGLKVVPLHTSGHADPDTIRALIESVHPNEILPIHTENAGWFANTTSSDQLVSRYLTNDRDRKYDPELFDVLREMSIHKEKNVGRFAEREMIPGAIYFDSIVQPQLSDSTLSVTDKRLARERWHQQALAGCYGPELVFMDPDNGLREGSPTARKDAQKFVYASEVYSYYNRGQDVFYYCHKGRRTETQWEKAKRIMQESCPDAVMLGITYHRGTQRSYIFVLHPEKEKLYRVLLKDFLETAWKDCFTSEPISQA